MRCVYHLLALLLMGLGVCTAGGGSPQAASDFHIEINPNAVVARQGSSVLWVNRDGLNFDPGSLKRFGSLIMVTGVASGAITHPATFVIDAHTGETVTQAAGDLILAETSTLYFKNSSEVMDRVSGNPFPDLVLLEFDVQTMKRTHFRVEINDHIPIKCFTGPLDVRNQLQYFKFVSKKGHLWTYKYSSSNCKLKLQFDDRTAQPKITLQY